MVILAFQANVRPTNGQKMDLLTVLNVFQKINFSDIGIVFTFNDTVNMNKRGDKWLNSLVETLDLE